MASFLYLLKICLYQNQFITDNQNIQDAMILSGYIMLILSPYFLKSPLAITAPRNDRDLWVYRPEYRNFFRVTMHQSRMIEAIQKTFMNHLWYLSEELVIFGLCDDHIDIAKYCAMACGLCMFPNHRNFESGKPLFQLIGW